MIDTIYIEHAVRSHPRTRSILARFPEARVIDCARYGEVFNPKAQNFRLQKQKPALILAEKFKNHVLEAPSGYGIGGGKNYYFSHMLNCLYDCRYCFLQGMYQSAHYVVFVNYESFRQAIAGLCAEHPEDALYFFSGYDADSLAMEPVTGFAQEFLPFFATLPNAWLELRTKSTQIRSLLDREPLPRCVVAFSLNPEIIAEKVEDKAPPLAKRLDALSKLQQHGWQIGLRFDPVIYQHDYQTLYRDLFARVFERLDPARLHSVNLGTFRLPEGYFKKMQKLYPDARLFAGPLAGENGMVSYRSDLAQDLLEFCRTELLTYIPEDRFFPCRI